VAILQKRINLPLGTFDIFVNVSGGLKIMEPSADLTVAMAIISTFKNKTIDDKTAVFGELGLLGEIRAVVSEERRIKEAKRIGFPVVICHTSYNNIVNASKILQ